MMQPARDQDAQVQQILDRLGITPQQVLHHHHTFGDRLSASTERLGAIIPEPVLPPIADGLRWRINPETLHANLQAALDPLGVEVRETPLTPEKLLESLENAKKLPKREAA